MTRAAAESVLQSDNLSLRMREFNIKAGFTKADGRLPAFFKNDYLPLHNATFKVKDEDLDTVFNW